MPSTTPDLRTVTCGGSSLRAAGGCARPDGGRLRLGEGRWRAAAAALRRHVGAWRVPTSARHLRTSRAAVRSASSGGGDRSAARTQIGRGGLAGARLGAFALLARRRGKQQIAPRLDGAGSAGPASAAPHCAARRAKRPPRARAAAADGWRRRICIVGDGWSRLNRKPPSSAAPVARRRSRPRRRSLAATRTAAPSQAARSILQLPHHDPKAEHDHAGAGHDHAGRDQRIAEAEFLDRNSEPIASRPASKKPIPATNNTIIIELTPGCAESRAAANATIPSYCGHRQPAIAAPVPPKIGLIQPEITIRTANSRRQPARSEMFTSLAIVASHQGKLRHNSQLPGKRTALYGCRGMRPKSAKAGP